MLVKLPTIADVKDFVKIMETNNLEGTLTHNIYRVDACSIMGVLSLDLTQPITLNLANEADEQKAEKLLEKYLVIASSAEE